MLELCPAKAFDDQQERGARRSANQEMDSALEQEKMPENCPVPLRS
jgi:hypothetical protein